MNLFKKDSDLDIRPNDISNLMHNALINFEQTYYNVPIKSPCYHNPSWAGLVGMLFTYILSVYDILSVSPSRTSGLFSHACS